MFRICSAYVPHMFRTCHAYSSHMSRIYVPRLPRICPAYVPYMSRICLTYVLHMSRICPAYVPHVSRICPTYVPHMSRICPAYVPHGFRTFPAWHPHREPLGGPKIPAATLGRPGAGHGDHKQSPGRPAMPATYIPHMFRICSAYVPHMFCAVSVCQVAMLTWPRLRARLPQVAPLQMICVYICICMCIYRHVRVAEEGLPACHANGPIRVPHMFRICSAYVPHMFRTEYACHLKSAKPGLPQVGSARGSSCHVEGMAQFWLRPRLPKVVILRGTCVYSAHMRVGGKGVAAYQAKSLAWVPHMFRICSAYVLHSPRAAGSHISPAQVEGQVAPGRPIEDDLSYPKRALVGGEGGLRCQ